MEKAHTAGARRGFGCVAAFVTALLVFTVVSLFSAALFVASPSSNNASASFIQPQTGAMRWNTHHPLTILLMGAEGPVDSHPGTGMMMVARVDPAGKHVTVLSIPDTLWVTIPGFGPGAISQAYAEGGARLALLAVQSVLHIAIPYYAVMSPDTFHNVVDAIGGITVRWTSSSTDWAGYVHTRLKSRHLSGVAATSYATVAGSVPGAAARRIRRQQRLMRGLLERLLSRQVYFQVPTLVNTFGGQIRTNFPYDQMPALMRVLLHLGTGRIAWHALGHSNYAVTDYRGGGAAVLLPSWNRIRSIATALFPDPGLGAVRVDVLNGAGVGGEAERLAVWLGQSRVRVRQFASAPAFNHPHTQVIMPRFARPAVVHVAQDVATLLQAPLVARHRNRSGAPVVVIIGQDFQDLNQQ